MKSTATIEAEAAAWVLRLSQQGGIAGTSFAQSRFAQSRAVRAAARYGRVIEAAQRRLRWKVLALRWMLIFTGATVLCATLLLCRLAVTSEHVFMPFAGSLLAALLGYAFAHFHDHQATSTESLERRLYEMKRRQYVRHIEAYLAASSPPELWQPPPSSVPAPPAAAPPAALKAHASDPKVIWLFKRFGRRAAVTSHPLVRS